MFVVIVGLAATNNMTGKVITQSESYSRGIDNIGIIDLESHLMPDGLSPRFGNSSILFNGTYVSNLFSNDYAYYSWEFSDEENNYKDYTIQEGDYLEFWTYTEPYRTASSISNLPCGVEIDFTDGSTLRWNHKDQDGIPSPQGNYYSVSQWLRRTIDISDMAGKTIKDGIKLVQENDQPTGTIFTCFFDSITILKSPSQDTPILNHSYCRPSPWGGGYYDVTVYNQSTADINNDFVKNIITWYITPPSNPNFITLLNMPFEGGSNATFTKDYTNHSNNGTITGAVWNSTGGYDGKGAYEFNGSPASIKVPRIPADYHNFTICAWIYPKTTSSFQTIATHGYATKGCSFGWDFYRAGTQIKLYTRNGSASIGVGGGNTPINQWSHVCASFNNVFDYSKRNTTLYVNSQIVASDTSSNYNLTFTDDYFKIGARLNTSDALPFNGTIDDVLFFKGILNSQQIKAFYENRTDLITSPLGYSPTYLKACITPNDGTFDGVEKCSNTLYYYFYQC